ncbi:MULTISPECIES: type II toxin-antitoxin system VapC family toxin [Nitrospirillum]|uniref:type II toxin-antitoxin system VapC family toxin n=1 Tax=Nitrospirillum amazonense TaxID=28077 RepID=UPI001FE442C5|nr:type II toxin-antitoxin system VapC family toxin [Nitrospirillum amazonense]MEC4591113.1 type II toxin-antitoxin system VapC family toxin [Nitrospirillum amazonense]
MISIVVDSSALIEIIRDGPRADECEACLERADQMFISAGTLAEALIVARRKGLGDLLELLAGRQAMTVVPITANEARRVADAYDRWGKGVHPAGLNMGDCYAYPWRGNATCRCFSLAMTFPRPT